ncbi:MAG: hypothetical protein R2864_13120 [Syntrophotaleaceae bacterium]
MTCAAAERRRRGSTYRPVRGQRGLSLRSNIGADAAHDRRQLSGCGCPARTRRCRRGLAAIAAAARRPSRRICRGDRIDLAQIDRPLVCCWRDPDDVRPLSAVAEKKTDDVFIGSCISHIGHFSRAALWQGQGYGGAVRTWLCPPTRMDQLQLKRGAVHPVQRYRRPYRNRWLLPVHGQPGAAVPDGVRVFHLDRNFDNRLGDGARSG